MIRGVAKRAVDERAGACVCKPSRILMEGADGVEVWDLTAFEGGEVEMRCARDVA